MRKVIPFALAIAGVIVIFFSGVQWKLNQIEAERNKIDTTEIVLNNEQLGLFRQGVDSAGAVSRNIIGTLPATTITIEWEKQCIIVRQSPIVPVDSLTKEVQP